MKLYFMKQQALDYLKANMGTLYKKYYQFDTPDWIYDLFDYDPFEVYDVVPDFELADLNLLPGEIDLQNCKILYTKLRGLSDSQASDERLWAGLCNKTFYSYMRTRWQYAKRHLKKTADDASAILSRFYYKSSGRSGMFRNPLARCWWTGRLTYLPNDRSPWKQLDAIGAEDIISKISDIFYSNNYSSNPEIIKGFCEGLGFFRERGIYISNRNHIRPTAQYLNALGGGVLLDTFTSNEIKKLVVERIGLIQKGTAAGLLIDGDDSFEDRIDEDIIAENTDAEEVNVDYENYIEGLEPSVEIDLEQVLGELSVVEYGCKVHIRNLQDNTFYISDMPLIGGKLNYIQNQMLGKKIGYKIKIGDRIYEIVDIRR